MDCPGHRLCQAVLLLLLCLLAPRVPSLEGLLLRLVRKVALKASLLHRLVCSLHKGWERLLMRLVCPARLVEVYLRMLQALQARPQRSMLQE